MVGWLVGWYRGFRAARSRQFITQRGLLADKEAHLGTYLLLPSFCTTSSLHHPAPHQPPPPSSTLLLWSLTPADRKVSRSEKSERKKPPVDISVEACCTTPRPDLKKGKEIPGLIRSRRVGTQEAGLTGPRRVFPTQVCPCYKKFWKRIS